MQKWIRVAMMNVCLKVGLREQREKEKKLGRRAIREEEITSIAEHYFFWAGHGNTIWHSCVAHLYFTSLCISHIKCIIDQF
jgi:hypothetical protein